MSRPYPYRYREPSNTTGWLIGIGISVVLMLVVIAVILAKSDQNRRYREDLIEAKKKYRELTTKIVDSDWIFREPGSIKWKDTKAENDKMIAEIERQRRELVSKFPEVVSKP